MIATENRFFKLAARPRGLPTRDVWEFGSAPVAAPRAGDVVVKNLLLSLDPAMRGWMNEGKSYIPPVGIGDVMRAGGVGRVVRSEDPAFAPGDYVQGMLGVQDYQVAPGKTLQKIDRDAGPLEVRLSVLGMPGMTAYFGLLEEAKPVAGETVVVSGAAGAVGMVVGQLAKIEGARVVGIAGGAEKCAYLTDELGFDAAIDYKTQDLNASLREHCPDGVDVYFDNVGGDALEAALARLAMHGRIIVCGAISQYNNTTPVKGPSNYLSLLVNRGTMKGIVVFDYAPRFGDAVARMAGYIADGRLKHREDVVAGLETFPETLLMLFKGENFGKLVLKVADDD